MKVTSVVLLFIMLLEKNFLYASPLSFQNSPLFSTENIKTSLIWFTKEPHPMGSAYQEEIAKDLVSTLKNFNLQILEQKFYSQVPNLNLNEFGGNTKSEQLTVAQLGRNIVATLPGAENCAVIVAGHYDTKFFRNFIFVGANDGGSSTALLIELARILQKQKFQKGTLGSCDVSIVFFDGEEAFLQNWDTGKKILQKEDNLYGSRYFANHLEFNPKLKQYKFLNKNIKIVMVLDMIGHKKQNISVTKGSDLDYLKIFINRKENLNIKYTPIVIEDDHTPFVKLKIPVVHFIDWDNLDEWHTVRDTIDILDENAIVNLGNYLVQLLLNVKLLS